MFRVAKLLLVVSLLVIGLLTQVEPTNANDPYYWNWWRPLYHNETCNANGFSYNAGYSLNAPSGATLTEYRYLNGVFQGADYGVPVQAGHSTNVVNIGNPTFPAPQSYPYTYLAIDILYIASGATSVSQRTVICNGAGQVTVQIVNQDVQ